MKKKKEKSEKENGRISLMKSFCLSAQYYIVSHIHISSSLIPYFLFCFLFDLILFCYAVVVLELCTLLPFLKT